MLAQNNKRDEIESNKRTKKGVVFENKDIANKEISIK
jgi:hypothetical protein